MGAWKSSDGGTIVPIGTSKASLTDTGVIVTAGANSYGVTIRTASLATNGTGQAELIAAGVSILAVKGAGGVPLPREVFVPAGQEISFNRTAGVAELGISYDIH